MLAQFISEPVIIRRPLMARTRVCGRGRRALISGGRSDAPAAVSMSAYARQSHANVVALEATRFRWPLDPSVAGSKRSLRGTITRQTLESRRGS